MKRTTTRMATALLLLWISVSAVAAPVPAHQGTTPSDFTERIIRFILRLPKLLVPKGFEDLPSIPKP